MKICCIYCRVTFRHLKRACVTRRRIALVWTPFVQLSFAIFGNLWKQNLQTQSEEMANSWIHIFVNFVDRFGCKSEWTDYTFKNIATRRKFKYTKCFWQNDFRMHKRRMLLPEIQVCTNIFYSEPWPRTTVFIWNEISRGWKNL